MHASMRITGEAGTIPEAVDGPSASWVDRHNALQCHLPLHTLHARTCSIMAVAAHHSRSSRYMAAHRRMSQMRASQRLKPVAVSARLAPSHASYCGPELIWATGRLMSPDRCFGNWNKLPALLRSFDSLVQFRRQLKTFLFVKD